jgi:uncharacterized iron-regulated membrane protein
MTDLVEFLKLLNAQPSPEFTAATKADVARLAEIAAAQQQQIDGLIQNQTHLASSSGAGMIWLLVLVGILAVALGVAGWYLWRQNERLRSLESTLGLHEVQSHTVTVR